MQTSSLGGNIYFFLLTDDYSRPSWVNFLQRKSDTLEKFKLFKLFVERQLSLPLKSLRTDRGGEFTAKEFKSFCELTRIRQQFTAPRFPQQNGIAERKNRTVIEMARTMLKEMSMPTQFWAEAVSTAIHILNRSPTSVLEDQTPYEALTGSKPGVKHFRIFGCLTYSLVDPQQR